MFLSVIESVNKSIDKVFFKFHLLQNLENKLKIGGPVKRWQAGK